MSERFPLETYPDRKAAAERHLFHTFQDALTAAGIPSLLRCVPVVDAEDLEPWDRTPFWKIEKVPGPVDVVALGRVCADNGWSLSHRESTGFHFSPPEDWYAAYVDGGFFAAEGAGGGDG